MTAACTAVVLTGVCLTSCSNTAVPLDMTELLLEGSERRQRHTCLGLLQVERLLCVTEDLLPMTGRQSNRPSCEVTSDLRSICWIGPVVGIGLVVGPTIVVSLAFLILPSHLILMCH